jgi:hypothetical protein
MGYNGASVTRRCCFGAMKLLVIGAHSKEGQPLMVGLLISIQIPETWCGGGDLNPYALRR